MQRGGMPSRRRQTFVHGHPKFRIRARKGHLSKFKESLVTASHLNYGYIKPLINLPRGDCGMQRLLVHGYEQQKNQSNDRMKFLDPGLANLSPSSQRRRV